MNKSLIGVAVATALAAGLWPARASADCQVYSVDANPITVCSPPPAPASQGWAQGWLEGQQIALEIQRQKLARQEQQAALAAQQAPAAPPDPAAKARVDLVAAGWIDLGTVFVRPGRRLSDTAFTGLARSLQGPEVELQFRCDTQQAGMTNAQGQVEWHDAKPGSLIKLILDKTCQNGRLAPPAS